MGGDFPFLQEPEVICGKVLVGNDVGKIFGGGKKTGDHVIELCRIDQEVGFHCGFEGCLLDIALSLVRTGDTEPGMQPSR